MRGLRFLAVLSVLAAGPAFAGGPAGRYVIDVEGTYQAMVAARADTPQTRSTLELQKNLMALVFEGDRLSLVAGGGLGGRARGSCRWRLAGDSLAFDDCRTAEGSAFRIQGEMRYEAETGAVIVHGNTPVPVRYIAE